MIKISQILNEIERYLLNKGGGGHINTLIRKNTLIYIHIYLFIVIYKLKEINEHIHFFIYFMI